MLTRTCNCWAARPLSRRSRHQYHFLCFISGTYYLSFSPIFLNPRRQCFYFCVLAYLFFIFIWYFFYFIFVTQTQEAAVDELAGFQLSDAEGMPSGFYFKYFFCVTTIFPPRQRAWAQKHLTIRIFLIFYNFFLSISRQRGADTWG